MDLSQFIHKIPKTETHLHIEGALPWSFLEELNPVKYSEEPYFRKADFRYKNFAQFESILIEHALKIFKTSEDYYRVASSIFREAESQNIRYVETSFHAGMIEFLKIPGTEILDAIKSAVPSGLEVRVFLGMSRNAYSSYLGPIIDEAVDRWDNLSGIDLHGPEDLPVEDWTLPIWERASAKGLVLKAHAGEFGPASNIQHAISQLGAKRIQHGVAAHESEMLLRQIVDEGICLDMCPISNFKLQVVDSWQDHPLPSFLKKGIQCTISTDDPFSFNNTLEDEYHACVNKLGLPISDLVQIAKNGFIVSDLSNLEKKRFIEEIDRTWDEFKGNDSSN